MISLTGDSIVVELSSDLTKFAIGLPNFANKLECNGLR